MLSEKKITKLLENINSEIRTLGQISNKTLREFVEKLLSSDQPWYVLIDDNNAVYWNPPVSGFCTFIPVFSHISFAEVASSSRPVHAERLSFPDVLALLRFAVFCGAEILYNESICSETLDPWELLLQIKNYFINFGDENLFEMEQDLKPYIDLINKARYPKTNGLCCVSDSQTSPALSSGNSRIVDCELMQISIGEYLHPFSVKSLFYLSGDIQLSIHGTETHYDSDLFKIVFALVGLNQTVFTHYELDENPADAQPKPITLTELRSMSCLDIARSAATQEKTDSDICSDLVSTSDSDRQNASNNSENEVFFDFEDEKTEQVIDVTKDQSYFREDRKKRIRRIYPSDDKKRANARLAAVVLIPFFFFICLLILISSLQSKSRNYNLFVAAVETSDYKNGRTFYESADNRQKYNKYLLGEYDETVTTYARGECTETEARMRIAELGAFPDQTSAASDAESRIAALSASKSAYSTGEDSRVNGDRASQILWWSKVIEQDEEHYPDIQRFFLNEKSENVAYVKSRLADAGCYEKTAVTELADAVCTKYPDEESSIRESVSEYLARCEAITDPAIRISSLDIVTKDDNSVALLIKWENCSNRTIRYVDFYFQFLDEQGRVVDCFDETGVKKTVFVGREQIGQYSPGFKTPDDTKHGWDNIWIGSGERISTVTLTGVDILYDGGEFTQIDDVAVLSEIFSKLE